MALTPMDLAVAALLLVAPAVLDLALKLGLTRSLAVAAVRTVLQLSFVGLVLERVFALDQWYFVLPVLAVMTGVAARAAVGRSSRRVRGAEVAALGSLVLATSVVVFSTTELVIGVDRWWAPQYVIPLTGMLLGNALTGVSLSLDRLLVSLDSERGAIDGRLALGMTLWEATLPWLRDALRTGMVPILNSMTVVGLVSLPGMMTGQILAGADPLDAVAYQILIMFMIAACTALASLGLCLLVWREVADPLQRLRVESILRR